MQQNLLKEDLGAIKDKYNPYLDSNAPWMSILAYNSYLINPTNGDRDFVGLMGENSKGYNSFLVDESGQIDEYTISFGGNALNVLYWGSEHWYRGCEFLAIYLLRRNSKQCCCARKRRWLNIAKRHCKLEP